MRVAICDDQSEVLSAVKEMLSKAVSDGTGEISDVSVFTDEKDFLSHLRNRQADIAIIDIMLKDGISGIDIAKQINRDCPDVSIIFISGNTDYAEEVYETKHCYFLKKPLTSVRLLAAIAKAAEESRVETIVIARKKQVVNIPVNHIVMAESLNRNIHIYLRSGEVISDTEKLSEFQCRLNSASFLRCHQSYVINMDHIIKMTSKEVILDTDTGRLTVPVSRRYAESVRNAFLRKLGGIT